MIPGSRYRELTASNLRQSARLKRIHPEPIMDIHPQTAAEPRHRRRRVGADRAARGCDPAARALQRGDSPRHREPGRLLVGARHAVGRAEPLRASGSATRTRSPRPGHGVLELRRRPAAARRPLPRAQGGGGSGAAVAGDGRSRGARNRSHAAPARRGTAAAPRCCGSRRSCSPRRATRRSRRPSSPSDSGSRAAASTTTSTRRRSCSSSSSRTSTGAPAREPRGRAGDRRRTRSRGCGG